MAKDVQVPDEEWWERNMHGVRPTRDFRPSGGSAATATAPSPVSWAPSPSPRASLPNSSSSPARESAKGSPRSSDGTPGGGRATLRSVADNSPASVSKTARLSTDSWDSLAGGPASCIRILRRLPPRVLYSYSFSIMMSVLTMFVLVGDDIRLMATDPSKDPIFYYVALVSLFLFFSEILLSCLAKDDYIFGFWFWADVFATASIIFDLPPVSEAMMDTPSISFDTLIQETESSNVDTEYARASRSGRVGTRVARLLRVVRLVRLSRILRVFHGCLRATQGPNSIAAPDDISGPGDGAGIEEKSHAESRVGRRLSELTTQRVIILVLAMLFVIPQMNVPDADSMMPSSAHYGADVVHQAWNSYEIAALQKDPPSTLEQRRRAWEMTLLMYIYYHNIHGECPDDYIGECAGNLLYKLIWVGYIPNPQALAANGSLDSLDLRQEAYVKIVDPDKQDWNKLFTEPNMAVSDMAYIVGDVPKPIQRVLSRPWTIQCSQRQDEAGDIYGVSLVEDEPCPTSTFRVQETTWYVPTIYKTQFLREHMEGQFVFVFDLRLFIQWEALMNVFTTLFIVIVLASGALLFSRDIDKLVLHPIELMINKVQMIRKDPLQAIHLGELNAQGLRFGKTGTLTLPQGAKRKRGKRGGQAKDKRYAPMETKILENAIIKLGSLLALGFGEAGSEIIGQNLDDDNAAVNAMGPGSKVEAIYGFCEIRDFATATSVLQERTMVFVNQVADIVHRTVDRYLGAANKNSGEAFLLVWRLNIYPPEDKYKIADLAVLSFVQVVAELNRNRQLAEYREHPALNSKIPGFRVTLGFGLHLGWSIEGAIGSEHKIEASYLSPHVNIATQVCAATMEYGVTILMTEPLVRSCNEPLSRNFRPIDHVKLSGSKAPLRLFSVDLHTEVLKVESLFGSMTRMLQLRTMERKHRNAGKRKLLEDNFQVCEVFANDPNIRKMRERFSLEFYQEFERGYLNYEAGEWDVAAMVLRRTRSLLPQYKGLKNILEDGPSNALLDYMARFNFKAPSDWKGWRELKGR